MKQPVDGEGISRDDLEFAVNRMGRSVTLREEAELIRAEFSSLANQWSQDTRHLSVISRAVAHPAHLRIVALGERALPLILEELRDRPNHWFFALNAIANVDPVPPGANVSMAREAWLEWGRRGGLVE